MKSADEIYLYILVSRPHRIEFIGSRVILISPW
jgi:hypothetical protein